jgi:class 3 adenylate cyclase
MAEQIPGARFVELDGRDHMLHFGDTDAIVGEIEEFVTGTRNAPVAERALATVMFTNIVGSTERAGELGDAACECEFIGDDIAGMAVHIGARVSATADAAEVVVSSTVKDLAVGSGIQLSDRGERELKGVPGSWRLCLAGDEGEQPVGAAETASA